MVHRQPGPDRRLARHAPARRGFSHALPAVEAIGAETGRIEIVETTTEKLVLDHLEIALPDECATLDHDRIEISPGKRVQILGKAGAGKSSLFRALAGMWPWGSGTIQLPPRQAMSFMPTRPYLPAGTLRAAVSYPAPSDRFEAAAVTAALGGVDLGHLVPLLDRIERWDRELPLDEQQRLAFARLLLHAPRWVVLDDALSAVSECASSARTLSRPSRARRRDAGTLRSRSCPRWLLGPNTIHCRDIRGAPACTLEQHLIAGAAG